LFCVFSGGRKSEIVLPDDGVCKYIVFDSVSPVKYTAKFTSLNSASWRRTRDGESPASVAPSTTIPSATRPTAGRTWRCSVRHVDLLVVVSHVPADQDFLQETEGLRQCLVTAASAWNADQLGNKNLISIQEAVEVIVNIKDAKARLFMSTTLGVWKYAVSAHSAQFTPTLHNITCDSRKMVPYAEVCRTNLTPGDGGRKTGVAYDYDARKSLWRWYETPESIYFKVQRAFKDLKDAHATDRAGFWAIYDVEMDDWDGECRSGVKRKPARLYRFADLTE
ncbi:hypothetical protein V5799_011325, partial [Amblyomma americanum]